MAQYVIRVTQAFSAEICIEANSRDEAFEIAYTKSNLEEIGKCPNHWIETTSKIIEETE